MNNDLISREALLKQTMEAQETLKSDNDTVWERTRGYFKGLAWANRLILDAPAVDISKRPQGEWGKYGECPFCTYIRQWKDDKFCGNCGARLTGGDNNDVQ